MERQERLTVRGPPVRARVVHAVPGRAVYMAEAGEVIVERLAKEAIASQPPAATHSQSSNNSVDVNTVAIMHDTIDSTKEGDGGGNETPMQQSDMAA